MFKLKFLKNFPFGVFIGSVFTLLLCLVFDADIGEDLTKVYTYLSSAALGMLASTIALSGVLAGLSHQTELREAERNRKLTAARALLPQALSDMCEVALSGIRNSQRAGVKRGHELEVEFRTESLKNIRLSDRIMSVFKDIIELSDGSVGDRIQGILTEHQVLQSRWSGYVSDSASITSPSQFEQADRICHWSFLYALTSTAFDYARKETKSIEYSVDEAGLYSALSIAGVHKAKGDPDFERAVERYARFFKDRYADKT